MTSKQEVAAQMNEAWKLAKSKIRKAQRNLKLSNPNHQNLVHMLLPKYTRVIVIAYSAILWSLLNHTLMPMLCHTGIIYVKPPIFTAVYNY